MVICQTQKGETGIEIKELQHADSVWTWKSATSSRVSLWLPYFDRVEKIKHKSKDTYRFLYNGGEVIAPLKSIEFIMLYGATGTLPIEFLDKLSIYRIPLMIHRRNMPSPYLFFPDSSPDTNDILSTQIAHRSNKIKCVYIARKLIHARFKSMEYLIPISESVYRKLSQCRTIDNVRILEAEITAKYWKKFYKKLSTDSNIARRDRSHPINKALNAASYFMSGVILRWCLFHKLSPEHGFLHVQTSYPSLIFDIIEPYRYIFEKALLSAHPKGGLSETDALTANTIYRVKKSFEEVVYTPATRQKIRRKNLLHGAVLSLRAYLIGDMRRLVIPVEGGSKGGRPLKVSFRIPGEIK